MTDVIAQLRKAWEDLSGPISSEGCVPKRADGRYIGECMWLPEAEDIVTIVNKMPEILAVLEEAAMLAEIDDYEGPRVATWGDFRAALSALKGGTR